MAYRRTDRMQQRTAERRRRILAAARSLFARNGYESTTMNRIVREAGTSIGNCYFYFANKEAILFAVVRDIIGEIWEHADEQLANTAGGMAKLAFIFYHSMTRLMHDDNSALLVLAGYGLPLVRKRMLEDFRQRVKRLVEEDPKVFRGGDADLEIYACLGVFFTVLERKRDRELTADERTIGRFVARWNLQALGYQQNDIDEALTILEATIIEMPANEIDR